MSHFNADLGRLGSIRSGNLEVRLAQTLSEIEAAQRLRFEVFYRERGAQPSPGDGGCRARFQRIRYDLRPSSGDRP